MNVNDSICFSKQLIVSHKRKIESDAITLILNRNYIVENKQKYTNGKKGKTDLKKH